MATRAGVVPPHLSTHVAVSFCPAETGNYYKRITVLFRSQGPKTIDLIGSAFTEKRRPAPLLPRHVHDYVARAAASR